MELYLQFGYGMMGLSRDLFDEWGGGTAILSPRDLNPKQLVQISRELQDRNGRILIDPQFYLPRADHHRLISHAYWPKDYDTQGFSDNNKEIMMSSLIETNNKCGAAYLIIPGERAENVDDIWIESQNSLRLAAKNLTDMPAIITICLSSNVVKSNEQISKIIEMAELNPVYGYYLVLEHPNYNYLVDDPQWLANSLDLVIGLRKLGSHVIVGYSNQQQLIMACAGATAIASGNWMNVRSFFPEKFRSQYEDEVKRRTTWYYCPQVFSEYTLAFLDIGSRLGVGDKLRAIPSSRFSDVVFSAPQPSASGWADAESFRHYLYHLEIQAKELAGSSFRSTLNIYNKMLSEAELILNELHEKGVKGQTRDFLSSVDATRAALIFLDSIHGPVLERRWGELISNL